MLTSMPRSRSGPAAGPVAAPGSANRSPAVATFFERASAAEISLVGRTQASPRDEKEGAWLVAGSETLGMIAAQQHTTRSQPDRPQPPRASRPGRASLRRSARPGAPGPLTAAAVAGPSRWWAAPAWGGGP